MATADSVDCSVATAADSPTTPLLLSSSSSASENDRSRRPRRQSLRDAARILRRASSRRIMREPSMLVRESAAEQLEERQSDWAYSKPVVVLDLVWNFAFVVAAVVVLILSREETPEMPLRVWVVGYALQCLLHMVCVSVEYRRRRRHQHLFAVEEGGRRSSGNLSNSLSSSPSPQGSRYVSLMQFEEDSTSSAAKHLESTNTMFSFIWWIIGFYWLSATAQGLVHESPQLYWLCITFMAFDVFFVIFCVALACIIGVAVCCCLPCIIALLYIVADEDGASKEDIEQLPKYKFRRSGHVEKQECEIQGSRGGIMIECGTESPIEQTLSAEDAECCICLSAYDDGAEIRELPCSHHFHCACVDKWLHINATCPLCKHNILKNSSSNDDDQV